jgi:hypothetical protein
MAETLVFSGDIPSSRDGTLAPAGQDQCRRRGKTEIEFISVCSYKPLQDTARAAAEFCLDKISHGLLVLVSHRSPPVEIVLNPDGNTVKMMLSIYDREYVPFGDMAKGFLNIIFSKVSDLSRARHGRVRRRF